MADGQATVRVRLPQPVSGPCHVRVFVRDDKGHCALGATDVLIQPHESSSDRAARSTQRRASITNDGRDSS